MDNVKLKGDRMAKSDRRSDPTADAGAADASELKSNRTTGTFTYGAKAAEKVTRIQNWEARSAGRKLALAGRR